LEKKAAMNKGLSDILKNSFPNIIPAVRPLIRFEGDFHPN
jgi:hypothetical protein